MYETKQKQLNGGDYILVDGHAWFTVERFAVRVRRVERGVECRIYENGFEDGDCIVSCLAPNWMLHQLEPLS